MIVIHSNTKCWRCNNKNAKRTCLSVFCNYGWWHVDASQCTAARASFGRCCSLCRQIMGFISSFFQPQSVTWCLVSRHQQKHILMSTKSQHNTRETVYLLTQQIIRINECCSGCSNNIENDLYIFLSFERIWQHIYLNLQNPVRLFIGCSLMSNCVLHHLGVSCRCYMVLAALVEAVPSILSSTCSC